MTTTIEQFPVRNRWTGEVQFTAEISVTPDMTPAMKLGLAVKWGVRAGANLARADLAGAYLVGANLVGANLAGAYLVGANLVGANLADANLADANLARAYLARAYLANANLAGADLVGANLARADLAGAYLVGAYLVGANLVGANLVDTNLADAYLADAKWRDGIVIQRAPLQLYGLRYPVIILDAHMQIGCELHSLAEWAEFDDRRILQMDGKGALEFWRAHGDALLGLARSDGRASAPGGEDGSVETAGGDHG